MNLFCLGINHRTTPVKIREQLWFSNDEVRRFLPSFKERHAKECVLVSTCNRTEMYYVPRDDQMNGELLWNSLSSFKTAGAAVTEGHFYSLSAVNSVKHLFNVASGIDSMVLGDVQILSQIKEAFAIAQELHSTSALLNRLFNTALHVGKRTKTETEISEGAVSISYAAAELASKIFQDLTKRTALLIGAGETGKLTAKHLIGRNIGKLLFANRTKETAITVANTLGGTVVNFENLPGAVEQADIVITAVNAPRHILSAQDLRQTMKTRGNRPLFIIDIGVPRNVDPEANRIGNIFLNDIDALNHIIDQNLAHRKAEIPKVEQIVLDEVIQFTNWFNSLEVTPTIQQLRDQFEEIRSSEIAKHLHHFSPESRETVDLVTKRIVNKILHTPMVNLKNGPGEGDEETRHKISLIRHLFGLDKRNVH